MVFPVAVENFQVKYFNPMINTPTTITVSACP